MNMHVQSVCLAHVFSIVGMMLCESGNLRNKHLLEVYKDSKMVHPSLGAKSTLYVCGQHKSI